MALVVHGDGKASTRSSGAKTELKIPDAFNVEAMAAMGKLGAKESSSREIYKKLKALTIETAK